MDIPQDKLQEYNMFKREYPETALFYNSFNDTYIVSLFKVFYPCNIFIKKIEVEETSEKIINKNLKIKTEKWRQEN
jgi:hypothetical protein